MSPRLSLLVPLIATMFAGLTLGTLTAGAMPGERLSVVVHQVLRADPAALFAAADGGDRGEFARRRCARGPNAPREQASAVTRALARDRHASVRSVRATSASYRSIDPSTRVIEEVAPASACVVRKQARQAKQCYRVAVTLRRTRPEGAAFSPWQAELGTPERLVCR